MSSGPRSPLLPLSLQTPGPYELTFQSCLRRSFRVTSTPVDCVELPPNASTTVSSAPCPRTMPCFRSSIASLANLKRECVDPEEKIKAAVT